MALSEKVLLRSQPTWRCRPTVPQVRALVEEFYALPGNGAGGILHIVLDDGNHHSSCIRWCLEEARKAGDWRAVQLAWALLQMSRTQRRQVC